MRIHIWQKPLTEKNKSLMKHREKIKCELRANPMLQFLLPSSWFKQHCCSERIRNNKVQYTIIIMMKEIRIRFGLIIVQRKLLEHQPAKNQRDFMGTLLLVLCFHLFYPTAFLPHPPISTMDMTALL